MKLVKTAKIVKVKPLTGKKLTDALDRAIREYFHRKYPYPTCFVCGKNKGWFHPKTNPYGCQIGHYISRRIYQLRWDFKNIEPQCAPDNYTHNYNTLPFTISIINKYGKERIEYLHEIYNLYKNKSMTTKEKRTLLEHIIQASNNIPH